MAPATRGQFLAQRRDICTNLMAEPTVEGIVLNSLDTTMRKEAEDKLQHDAFHDSLTGLPNRSLFKEYLKTAIGRTKRSKGHLYAVLFLDLDRFKNINDSLGHTVGDELLVSIARRLELSIRQNVDIVARLGGDEFAVLLDGMADTNVAIHIARRIQDALRTAVDVSGHEISPLPASALRYQPPPTTILKIFCEMLTRPCTAPKRAVGLL